MKTADRKRGYKNVTESDFDVIKKLQGLKIGQTQAMAITKRGAGTVHNAYRSKDFAEFRNTVQAQGLKYNLRAKAETPVNATPIPQGIFSNRGKTEVTETSVAEALLQVNATLQELVKAWNKAPKQ